MSYYVITRSKSERVFQITPVAFWSAETRAGHKASPDLQFVFYPLTGSRWLCSSLSWRATLTTSAHDNCL